MSETPFPEVLEQMQEETFYNIQLTCGEGRKLKVMNGKVFKKKNSQPLYTMEYDGNSSEGEVVERDTYTYTFFMNDKAVGTLVVGEQDKDLYLKLTSGRRVRVGCSIKINGVPEKRKAFLF